MELNLDTALLLLNGWLDQPVRLLVLIHDGAPPDEPPPPGPAQGWHVLLGCDAKLRRLPVETDMERQLTVGTYGLGDHEPIKLLLDDLPCERILTQGGGDEPDSLAFYLPGVTVLVFQRLPQ